jgi:hypothetical protein
VRSIRRDDDRDAAGVGSGSRSFLVVSDTNEEGANLLAPQTRRKPSSTCPGAAPVLIAPPRRTAGPKGQPFTFR